MPIHEERMAVISTAHLSQRESRLVDSFIKNDEINGMTRNEGWLIHTGESVAGMMYLSFVLGYMKAKGFDWVLFDRDADTVDELPEFDW